MNRQYAVSASLRWTEHRLLEDQHAGPTEPGHHPWSCGQHLPTFYLDATVQGIVSEEHAVRIAQTIVDPMNCYVLMPTGPDLFTDPPVGRIGLYIHVTEV
jgi:hypothetical protein